MSKARKAFKKVRCSEIDCYFRASFASCVNTSNMRPRALFNERGNQVSDKAVVQRGANAPVRRSQFRAHLGVPNGVESELEHQHDPLAIARALHIELADSAHTFRPSLTALQSAA